MKLLTNRIMLSTVLAVLLLNMTSCQNGESVSRKDSVADSLNMAAEDMVRAVAMSGDAERTIGLADSLLGQNLLTPIKADFYDPAPACGHPAPERGGELEGLAPAIGGKKVNVLISAYF